MRPPSLSWPPRSTPTNFLAALQFVASLLLWALLAEAARPAGEWAKIMMSQRARAAERLGQGASWAVLNHDLARTARNLSAPDARLNGVREAEAEAAATTTFKMGSLAGPEVAAPAAGGRGRATTRQQLVGAKPVRFHHQMPAASRRGQSGRENRREEAVALKTSSTARRERQLAPDLTQGKWAALVSSGPRTVWLARRARVGAVHLSSRRLIRVRPSARSLVRLFPLAQVCNFHETHAPA